MVDIGCESYDWDSQSQGKYYAISSMWTLNSVSVHCFIVSVLSNICQFYELINYKWFDGDRIYTIFRVNGLLEEILEIISDLGFLSWTYTIITKYIMH